MRIKAAWALVCSTAIICGGAHAHDFLYYDMGPPGSAVPDGFMLVTEATTYAPPYQRYGWLDATGLQSSEHLTISLVTVE